MVNTVLRTNCACSGCKRKEYRDKFQNKEIVEDDDLDDDVEDFDEVPETLGDLLEMGPITKDKQIM